MIKWTTIKAKRITLFIKCNSFDKLIVLIVYVDDIIIIGNDKGETQRLIKTYLPNKFEIKNLGTLKKYFLEIDVAHSKEGIFISQQKYILDLLKETGILRCKLAKTLIEQNHKLGGKMKNDMVNYGLYQRLVGN